jgi:hypothetical protein
LKYFEVQKSLNPTFYILLYAQQYSYLLINAP